MAVKKHELVHDNRNQLDLQALEQYIQLMNDQSNYMPPPQELVKNCQDIVKWLGKFWVFYFERHWKIISWTHYSCMWNIAARASGNEEQMWTLLQTVEEYLLRVVNTVHTSIRHEIVTAILDKFYTFISDPREFNFFVFFPYIQMLMTLSPYIQQNFVSS